MKKFMKYEFMGTYHIYLLIFSVMTVVNLFLFSRIGKWNDINVFVGLVCFGAFISILLFTIKSYLDELETDSGYLTFTLPIKNKSILNCKLVFFLFWTSVWFILSYALQTIAFNLLKNTYDNMSYSIFGMFKAMDIEVKIGFLSIVFIVILTIVLLIYFSTTITKMALRGKNINKFLAFAIFLVVTTILILIDTFIMKNFQSFLYIGDKNIAAALNNRWTLGIGYTANLTKIMFNGKVARINIASLIYSIVVIFGLHYAIGYLLENKVSI